ncbi:retron Ec67 family RNA-directed DNA polymerase/endonuclease [Lichenihabitans sp. PAMC28606]|uniref:retron Ec67 family RNA-directed DNA polymerase/endonuclease n=1 Tax=Lichenihabitans sp. PAMC28606 TaxID=2880932 RepID=UPI001D0B7F14|nr:retron Ec67 family RNA-directed DNA polymerase/endonuclease [Lichenihabitans sp. PAMC28606]UDL96262.1 retron Ec67 family RNA-directed DNA polymerase/endonuclease [Lichenihabitans sp. PAMC28606]
MLLELRQADTLERFAALLNYTPSGLSFILYKMDAASKYTTFEVTKASGGVRMIHAPHIKLKRLQKALANILLACNVEIETATPRRPLSHGFEKKRSIFTNAWEHKNRRYVLNLDIEDFFPTINFGRVRGFFIKSHDFTLPEKTATLIAQIACRDGKLPQGSPCSPIIANLVAHLLDVRLVGLAKRSNCSYTRYADDITFSTNQQEFPAELAAEDPPRSGTWVLSEALIAQITRTGFTVNNAKTRMQCRPSQQLVTGLTVNQKVNIRAAYYARARIMCSSLFNHGHYHVEMEPAPAPAPGGTPGKPKPKLLTKTATLEGILSHIYHIKHAQELKSNPETYKAKDPEAKKKTNQKREYPGYRKLYKKFLYFRHFVSPTAPLVMCEGKTDNIYLRSALKGLDPSYPRLAEVKDGKLFTKGRFLKHSRAEHDILELSGGSGNIANFIAHYRSAVFNYKHRPMKYPVIILLDNDSGGNAVFNQAKEMFKIRVGYDTTEAFYHLCHNLYLIKTPEMGRTGESCMEDLFDEKTRKELVDGKTFNPKADKDTATQYGKMVFADRVVRANYAMINFDKFKPLLERIVAVLDHFDANKPKAAT